MKEHERPGQSQIWTITEGRVFVMVVKEVGKKVVAKVR